jgi:general secretion pathway protein N
LGTPFNTLQMGGTLRLTSNGMTLESVQGRWRAIGSIDADLLGVSSRLSTLDTLGSYRFSVRGGATSSDPAALNLETLEGALRLSGSGQWTGFRVRFRGEASAAEGQEAALNNLLNIIGRRQGATSVISIG